MHKNFIRWLKEIGLFNVWKEYFITLKEAKYKCWEYRREIPIISFVNICEPIDYIDYSFLWYETYINCWGGLDKIWRMYCYGNICFDELVECSKQFLSTNYKNEV